MNVLLRFKIGNWWSICMCGFIGHHVHINIYIIKMLCYKLNLIQSICSCDTCNNLLNGFYTLRLMSIHLRKGILPLFLCLETPQVFLGGGFPIQIWGYKDRGCCICTDCKVPFGKFLSYTNKIYLSLYYIIWKIVARLTLLP